MDQVEYRGEPPPEPSAPSVPRRREKRPPPEPNEPPVAKAVKVTQEKCFGASKTSSLSQGTVEADLDVAVFNGRGIL